MNPEESDPSSSAGGGVEGLKVKLRYGSFRKFGVPYFGVLITRIHLGYYIRLPEFRKLPYEDFKSPKTPKPLIVENML